jgi:hypothetical protein
LSAQRVPAPGACPFKAVEFTSRRKHAQVALGLGQQTDELTVFSVRDTCYFCLPRGCAAGPVRKHQ